MNVTPTQTGYSVGSAFVSVYPQYQNFLGSPTSGVTTYGNARYQIFQNGSMVSSSFGTYALYGGIRQAYLATGGLAGRMGVPTGAAKDQGNGVLKQTFENGYVIWNGNKATAYMVGSGLGSISSPINQPLLGPNPTPQNPLRGFIHPLGGAGSITQGNGGETSHRDRQLYAIDYGVPIGTPVYAMRSGRVVAVRDIYPDTGGGPDNINRFNYVTIEHDGGYRSAYLHLQQGFNDRTRLFVGNNVNAGQLIGYSGNSGWSTGPHLHVEIHKSSSGYFGQTVPFEISQDSQGILTEPRPSLPGDSSYLSLYSQELVKAFQAWAFVPPIVGGGPTTWQYAAKYGDQGAARMLDDYKDLIIKSAEYYGIDGRSIAGAIRWEYELNKPSRERDQFWYAVSIGTEIAGAMLGKGVGWGKMHFDTARKILEEEGHSPSDDILVKILALAPSAIDMIGKYMRNATITYLAESSVDISRSPEILTTLYQTGRIEEKAKSLAERRKTDPQAQPQISDEKTDVDDNPFSEINVENMGSWVNNHLNELADFKTIPTRDLPLMLFPGEPGYVSPWSNIA